MRRLRRWSREEKELIVGAAMEPGASEVARPGSIPASYFASAHQPALENHVSRAPRLGNHRHSIRGLISSRGRTLRLMPGLRRPRSGVIGCSRSLAACTRVGVAAKGRTPLGESSGQEARLRPIPDRRVPRTARAKDVAETKGVVEETKTEGQALTERRELRRGSDPALPFPLSAGPPTSLCGRRFLHRRLLHRRRLIATYFVRRFKFVRRFRRWTGLADRRWTGFADGRWTGWTDGRLASLEFVIRLHIGLHPCDEVPNPLSLFLCSPFFL